MTMTGHLLRHRVCSYTFTLSPTRSSSRIYILYGLFVVCPLVFYLTFSVNYAAVPHISRESDSIPESSDGKEIILQSKIPTENTHSQILSTNVRSKYHFSSGQNHSSLEVIEEIKNLLMLPWEHNATNRDKIREHFAASGANTSFYMSPRQDEIGERMILTTRHLTVDLSKKFYNDILRKGQREPFRKTRPKTCSVVGSSGILLNSHCGVQIDNVDAVFRLNAPKLKQFEEDSGKKSTVTTFNKSIFEARYGSLKTYFTRRRFVKDMMDIVGDGFLCISMHAQNKTSSTITRAIDILRKGGVKFLIMHPVHLNSMNEAWRQWGMDKFITSGLYMTSVAIGLCEEVNLYGFWPLDYGLDGEKVPFHYYDQSKRVASHNFSLEFIFLLELHRLGVIKLNINPCA